MRIRTAMMRLIFHVEQTHRIISMQLFLAPAAYALPRGCASALADALALFLLSLPSPGMDAYFTMRQAFGKTRLAALYFAWRWLARPFRDFVVLKRALSGRESPFDWRIVERNAEAINSLRESGQSYIVATAHFAREAFLATAAPSVARGNLVQVGLPPPRRVRSLYDLRMRIQYGTMLKALASVWGRDCEFVYAGSDQVATRTLYTRLRERGNVVNIHVDAPWREHRHGAYARPFAALKRRVFATGAAELARLTQCPIVSCVYFVDGDGTMVLEWGSPIRCVDNVIGAMDRLIDPLETAVGERPTQYMLNIGGARRWDAAAKCWRDSAG